MSDKKSDDAQSRFVGTADSVAPLGGVIRHEDNTSDEDRRAMAEHDKILAEARKTP